MNEGTNIGVSIELLVGAKTVIRELWGEYECHFSCVDCDPSNSCKEGMTCLDDVSFVEFLIDHLIQELNVDPRRVHVTGLSNGAQERKLMTESPFNVFMLCV